MAAAIIPHVCSIPRWLGRPRLLTRRSHLPVRLWGQVPSGVHAVCASIFPQKEQPMSPTLAQDEPLRRVLLLAGVLAGLVLAAPASA
jgi:hypothetical protein